MSKKNEKVSPQIRFRKFSEDWREKKIGNILSETKRPIVLQDDQRYELVTVRRRNDGVISRGYLYGREILVKNYSQLAAGDYLISKRQVVHGATGIVPNSLDGAIVSNEYLVAVGNDEITTDFLTLLSKRPAMYRNFFLSSYGVVIEKLFFDVEDWKKRTVTIPEVHEQNQICSFFKSLDRMIELHLRKHGKLVTLKQAMLQKMFPQDGATTPEIRFNGFDGEWNERRLGDEPGEIVAGGDVEKHKLREKGEFPVLANALRNSGILGYYDNEFRVEAPAVTVTGRGDIGHAVARHTNFTPVVRLISVKTDHDVDFLEKAINNTRVLVESTGVPQLTVPQLSQFKIRFPCDVNEEKRIGAYFRNLDLIISKHASQLKKLRNIKSACLEKMFV